MNLKLRTKFIKAQMASNAKVCQKRLFFLLTVA